jgi:DNA-binding NarL/FixJ family response regulator
MVDMITRSGPQSQTRRVVVLEPQLLFVPHLVRSLEANGCRVIGTMPSIDEATLASLSPDVVFVDIGTSENASSFATLRRVRQAVPRARLVVYGGTSSATWRATAWAQGVDEVLTDRDGVPEFVEAAHSAFFEPVPTPW